LRRISQNKGNLTNRWRKTGHIPSGWGHVETPGAVMKGVHYFYRKLQSAGSKYTPGGNDQQDKLQASAHTFVQAAEDRADARVYKETAS
jgi:hypothetical protein